MSGLLSHFASATLLLHMLLGCCWHHAHAVEPCSSATPVGQHGNDCGEGAICGQQDSCGQGSPAGENRRGSGHCLGSHCVFTVGERFTTVLNAQFLNAFLALAPPSETQTAPPAAVCGPERPVFIGPCPPLRLHLVNQVLLI